MTNPLRILIVEDSADDAEVTLLELSRGGLAPDWKRVETADEMRVALAEGPWDAVLSDYSLPGFSAAEALALCQESDPDLPFVVVSGIIGEERAVEMMRAGASDYLMKGSLGRLAPAVEREVREAAGRRTLKRAEAEMRASETRYRRVFEAARDGILIVDPDTRKILDANPYLTELLGYRHEEFVGKELWEISLFSDIEANQAAFRTLQEQGYIRYEDLPLATKDGHQIQVEFVSNRYDAGDAPVIQCNIRDITERKHAEEAIRVGEARFRAVIESEMLATFFWEEEGRISEANNTFLALVGYTQDDLQAGELSWVAMSPPECRARDLEALAEIARTGRCRPYEKEYRRKDGSLVPILVGAASLNGGGKNGSGKGVAFAIDLTERKQAEQGLRMFRALIDHAMDGIEVIDPDTGRFLDVNVKACEAHGYTREEYLRMSVADITPQPISKPWPEWIEEHPHPTLTFESLHQRKDGSIFPVEVSFNVIELDRRYMIAVVRDITDRKKAEADLQRSEVRYRTLITATTSIVWDSPASGESL